MKKVFTTIAILTSLFVTAQSDTTRLQITSVSKGEFQYALDYTAVSTFVMQADWGNRITLSSDSVITVEGDTMKVLVAMFKMVKENYRREDSVRDESAKTIRAAVNYTNLLPDNLKNDKANCKWSEYQYWLRRQGYSLSRNEKIKSDCK